MGIHYTGLKQRLNINNNSTGWLASSQMTCHSFRAQVLVCTAAERETKLEVKALHASLKLP